MIYENQNDLVSKLYLSFLERLQENGIFAHTGSGSDILPFITQGVVAAIESGEIPRSASDTFKGQLDAETLTDSVLRLADQMIEDAREANTDELHEWSLYRARRKLCPLWPFLREPCSQYD